jgi:hypothetical protein
MGPVREVAGTSVPWEGPCSPTPKPRHRGLGSQRGKFSIFCFWKVLVQKGWEPEELLARAGPSETKRPCVLSARHPARTPSTGTFQRSWRLSSLLATRGRQALISRDPFLPQFPCLRFLEKPRSQDGQSHAILNFPLGLACGDFGGINASLDPRMSPASALG